MARRQPLRRIADNRQCNSELSEGLRGQTKGRKALGQLHGKISKDLKVKIGTIRTTVRRDSVRTDSKT